MDRIVESWKTPVVLFLSGLLMWFVSLHIELGNRERAAEQRSAEMAAPLPASPAPPAPQWNEIQDFPQLD